MQKTDIETVEKFHANPLPKGILQPGMVPYVGLHGVECLKKKGVTDVTCLVGVFLIFKRSEKTFSNWLFRLGFSGVWADLCAAEIAKKVKNL